MTNLKVGIGESLVESEVLLYLSDNLSEIHAFSESIQTTMQILFGFVLSFLHF